MALTKIKLGELIRQSSQKNEDESLSLEAVRGISTQKQFIETHADMEGVPLKNYKVVKPNEFAYVADTSRRGDKISLAFNVSDEHYLVSSISTVFYVEKTDILNPLYLFMYFNRPEFDRYSRFNSWGSAREAFDWETMCDIEIELPDLATQQKYVDIYKGMVANQAAYERGLDDLKLVCDGYIENLRRKFPCEEIGKYIEIVDEVNVDDKFTVDDVLGVSKDKVMMPTKSDVKVSDLPKFTIISNNDFVYNPRNGIAISLFKGDEKKVISFNNTAFRIKKEMKNYLSEDYLFLFLKRSEWDRKVAFDSWGSSTEVYSFAALGETKIPIVDYSIQQAISKIGNVFVERMQINEQLKQQIKNLCPILIRGAVEEAQRN